MYHNDNHPLCCLIHGDKHDRCGFCHLPACSWQCKDHFVTLKNGRVLCRKRPEENLLAIEQLREGAVPEELLQPSQ